MDGRRSSRQLSAAYFGSFPSVNPITKLNKEQNNSSLEDDSSLCLACAMGDYDTVRRLINDGCDIDEKDALGSSPILNAASNGHKGIIEFLVARGAKIEYDLLCSVKSKIEVLEEDAKMELEDPYVVAEWKQVLDYLIEEGKKQ